MPMTTTSARLGIAAAVLLLSAACASSGFPAASSTTTTSQPVARSSAVTPSTTTTTPAGQPLLPARIVLSSSSVKAGAASIARVVVDNNTGHPVDVYGCKRLFAVILTSVRVRQVSSTPSCIQQFVIPKGDSIYPVTFETRYSKCAKHLPSAGVQACLADGKAPPLPVGGYDVVLVDTAGILRAPRPVPVLVVPAVAPLPKCVPFPRPVPVKTTTSKTTTGKTTTKKLATKKLATKKIATKKCA